ncbi:MAG: alpha/beta fold hydrolase [Acidobacteria bacterium]|nr:alpha/beta fold hydrolase [Acidobacteriota bacterium]
MLVAFTLAGSSLVSAQSPLVITGQGARPFGGRVVGDAATGSIHCDHGYVEWQIPQTPRRLPLVMVHASSTKTWDTTFDGRDGFRQIFLRRGFPVYLTDLPRTGRAGQGCAPTSYAPRPDNDQAWFTIWRLGLWLPGDATPDFYPGVQFSRDPRALDEFFRIQYPEFNAPENEQVETDALAALLNEVGPSVLLTHSSTGIRGWITALKTSNVAGIVSYEPGDVVLPESEMPPPIPRADGMRIAPGRPVPMAEFLKLTRMPVQIVWGDYIPVQLDPGNIGPRLTLDSRRINVVRARLMVDAINRHGGRAVNVMLPDLGIRGNTHFPMLDLNNVKIADLLSDFLKDRGLDRR